MAAAVSTFQDLQVSGKLILAYLNALGRIQTTAFELLERNNITNPLPTSWYPLSSWLNTLEYINNELGPNTLFMIGKKIFEAIEIPEELKKAEIMEEGLANLDKFYHFLHKDSNGLLYSVENDSVRNGIGHYKYSKTGINSIRIISTTPYPADLSRGIVTRIARRYDPLAHVILESSMQDETVFPNTQHTFLITWEN